MKFWWTRPPNYFFEKIWEIWEFFSEKYGRNMGDFGIFMAKFGKNMGNMGDFQPFFPSFFHIFNHQIVIFVTLSGQSPRLLVCSNLVIWSFLGTLDKCLCTLVSIFPKFSVWGPHEHSIKGSKPKNCDFRDIVQSKPPVGGLFKFCHMSFFWDCR